MPTLAFKATEMKAAKVVHISLVDRAATRMPFKVIKQENPMKSFKHLDLASVFKREAIVESPEIVGVITMKSEGYQSIAEGIADAGFDVSKADELEDGSVVFSQSDASPEDCAIIRISDNAVLAVKSFRPYNVDMTMADGTSFSDVVKAQGFSPGVGTMVDVLRFGVLSMAEKSDDPEAAAQAVAKMFDEARNYTVAMVKALPSKAFKLESLVPALTEKKDDTSATSATSATSREGQMAPEGMSDEEAVTKGFKPFVKGQKPGAAPGVKATAGKVADADAADEGAEADGKKKGNPFAKKSGETSTEGVSTEQVSGIIAAQMTEFATKMESLLSGVTKAVGDLGGEVKSLAIRVESAESVAKAANEAVSSTLVTGSSTDDHASVKAQKGEYKSREIDTAYQPRRAGR